MSKSREPALQCADDGCSDPAFHVLAEAYRATGGTVGGHELARRLEAYRDAYFMSLEKLIAARIVFGFEWRGTLWIPMFQFDQCNLAIKQGSRLVLAELASVFDGWALALWFVRPSLWLNSRRPIDLVDSNPLAVVQAARAERLSMGGPAR